MTIIRTKDGDFWYSKGPVFSTKASMLHKRGEYEEANKCYDKAIELEPKYAIAWYEKGIALNMLGKNKDSEKCFKKAKELGHPS